MILRKPYAFLIRNFKLIHLVLSTLMVFIIYKFNNILSFFNEYMSMTPSVISKDVVPALYPKSIAIFMVIMFLFTIIVMSLMQWKKKPIGFYSFLIFSIIGSALVLYYSYTVTVTLKSGLVAVKTLRMARDLCLIAIIAQFLGLIILIVRAIGFDIKKFDFGRQMLKVNETDREEFEFDVSFDADRFKRNLKRNIRNFKYTYRENKLLINLVIAFIIAIICGIIYVNINIYNKKYDENTTVSVDGFTFGVTSSNYTKYDYRGNVISEDEAIVAINLKIKSNSKTSSSININNFELNVGKKTYSINSNYNLKLFDLGTIYTNQIIGGEFENYVLIFSIPDNLLEEKIILLYNSNSSKNIRFKIKPISIDKEIESKDYNIEDTISFEGSLIDGTSLIINNIDVQNKFRIDYNFCLNGVCTNSYEYIYRSLTENYDKTILKIDYSYSDSEKKIDGVNNIYDLISKMSYITYTVNGEEKTNTSSLNQIKPTNTVLKNTMYLEVDQDIINASDITIHFKIREKVYNYKLR